MNGDEAVSMRNGECSGCLLYYYNRINNQPSTRNVSVSKLVGEFARKPEGILPGNRRPYLWSDYDRLTNARPGNQQTGQHPRFRFVTPDSTTADFHTPNHYLIAENR